MGGILEGFEKDSMPSSVNGGGLLDGFERPSNVSDLRNPFERVNESLLGDEEAKLLNKTPEGLSRSELDEMGGAREYLAQKQNETFMKSVGTFSKIVPRAATSFLSETLKIAPELAGTAAWAATGFDLAKFDETVNNAVVKGIDELHEKTNDALFPVYKRKAVENGGFLRQIGSPEFWATEGADGIGFLTAFMVPGAVLRGAKLGKNSARAFKVFTEKGIANMGKIDDFAAASINTVTESVAEGIEAYKSTKEDLYNQKVNELTQQGVDHFEASARVDSWIETPEAKRIMGEAAANTVKANMAILIGPNILDQKWLFNSFRRSVSSAATGSSKLAEGIAKEGEGFLTSISKYTGADKLTKAGQKLAIGVGKEGFFEEGMQFTVSDYFKDKAISGDSEYKASEIINDYMENLGSNVDMQKSVFLGGLLGGGMSTIGAYKEANREDKMLFGDGKKKGLIKLLQDNFVSRYKSMEDLKDDNGKLIPEKVARWSNDVVKTFANDELLNTYVSEKDKESFEFAKFVSDMNYMLPYFQQEGGKDLLVQHINKLAEEDTKYMKEVLGLENVSSEEIKRDLLEKADIFEKIYHRNNTLHKVPNFLEVPKGKEDLFKEFNNILVDTKTSVATSQKFLEDKITKVKSQIDELGDSNAFDVVEERAKLNSQLKQLEENFNDNNESYKELTSKPGITKLWETWVKADDAFKAETKTETAEKAPDAEEQGEESSGEQTEEEGEEVAPEKKKSTEGVKHVQGAIKAAKAERESVRQDIASMKSTAETLNTLLKDKVSDKSEIADKILAEINNLQSLITSKGKVKTKFGTDVNTKITTLREALRDEYSVANELTEMIRDFNKYIVQSRSIISDLSAKIEYYNGLINEGNTSDEALFSKLEDAEKSRGMVEKLINKLEALIKRLVNFLQIRVAYTEKAIQDMEDLDFTELSTEELAQAIKSGTADEYAELKAKYKSAEEAVNDFLSDVEKSEANLKQVNNRLYKLQAKMTRIDNEVRYLEELLHVELKKVLPKPFKKPSKVSDTLNDQLHKLAQKLIRIDVAGSKEKFSYEEKKLLAQYDQVIAGIADKIADSYLDQYIKEQEEAKEVNDKIAKGDKVKVISMNKVGTVTKVSPNSLEVLIDGKTFVVKKDNVVPEGETVDTPAGSYTYADIIEIKEFKMVLAMAGKVDKNKINSTVGGPQAYKTLSALGIIKDGKWAMSAKDANRLLEKERNRLAPKKGEPIINPQSDFVGKYVTVIKPDGTYFSGKVSVVDKIDDLTFLHTEAGVIVNYNKDTKEFSYTTQAEMEKLIEEKNNEQEILDEMSDEETEAFNKEANRDENPVSRSFKFLKNTLQEVISATSNYVNDRWVNLKSFAFKADSFKNHPQPIKWNALVNNVRADGLAMEVYVKDKVTNEGKEYERIVLIAKRGDEYLYMDDNLELQTTTDITKAYESNTFSTFPESRLTYEESSDGLGFRFREPEWTELEALIKNLTLTKRNTKLDFFGLKIKTSAKTVGELADSMKETTDYQLQELLYANIIGHDFVNEMTEVRKNLEKGDVIPISGKTPGVLRESSMELEDVKEIIPRYNIFVSEIKEKGLQLGRTYFEDKDTGNFYELKTKPLNSIPSGNTNIKQHLLNMFKAFAATHVYNPNDGRFISVPAKAYGNKSLLAAIGDFVFIQPRQNLTKAGLEAYKAAETRFDKDAIINSSEYLISKNPLNNLYLVGNDIVIGGITYPFLEDTKDATIIPPSTLSALEAFLDTRWMNISANKLNAKPATYTFIKSSEFKDGKLIVTKDDLVTGIRTASKGAYQDALEQLGVLSTIQLVSKDNFTPDRVNGKFVMDYGKISKATEFVDEVDEFEDFDEFTDFSDDEVMFKDEILHRGKPINIEEAQKWFKKTFGNLDIKVVNGLIKKKNLGASTRDAIWLSKQADAGTEYHEAFHRVYNYLLTQREVDNVFSAAKEDKRVQAQVERIKKLVPNKSEEWYIEEALAEAFADYMLDKQSAKKYSSKVTDFFERLWNWITNFFGKLENDEQLITDLFDKIDEGKFATVKAKSDVDTFSTKPYKLSDAYASGESFKYTESEYFADMVNKSVHAILMTTLRSKHSLSQLEKAFTNNIVLSKALNDVRYIHIPNSLMIPSLIKILTQNKKLTGDAANFNFGPSGILSIFANDRDRLSFQKEMGKFVNRVLLGDLPYEDFIQSFKDKFFMYFDNEKFDILESTVLPAINENFNKIKNASSMVEEGFIYRVKSFSMILDHWGQTMTNYFEYLNKFNIKVEIDEEAMHNLEEEDNRRNDGSNYSYLSVQVDGKKTTPRSLKLILSSIKSMTEINGKETPNRNALGIGETIDFGHVYSVLISRLSGTTTEKRFTEVLREMVNIPNSGAADILKTIMKPGETMEDIILLAKFLQNFMKGKNHFLMNSLEGTNNTLVDTRKNIHKRFLTNVWANNFDSKYLTNGKYSRAMLDGIDNEYSDDNLKELLGRMGIEFSSETAYSYNRPALREIFKYLYTNIRTGSVPDIYSASEDMVIGRQFNNIIDIEIATGVLFSENSHNNIDGKSVYDSSLYNFMTVMLSNLAEVKSKEEFDEMFPHLKEDPYFEHSIILHKLFTSTGARTEYDIENFINEGARIKSTRKAYPYNKFNNHERLFDQFNMYNAKDGISKYPVIRPGDNKLERFLGLGRFVKDGKSIVEGKSLKDIISGYIYDELNFIYENKEAKKNNERFSNIDKAVSPSKEWQPRGIVLDLISMYDAETGTFLENTDKRTASKDEIENMLESLTLENMENLTADLSNSYQEIIESYFEKQGEKIFKSMKNGKMFIGSATGLKLNGLTLYDENGNSYSEIGEAEFKDYLVDFFINDWISNNEQFKFLFAHPSQYKALIDVFKRITGAVGTKKIQIIDGQVDKYILDKMTRLDKFSGISKNGKDRVMRVGVIDDVQAVSQYIKAYGLDKMDETDGFSFISMDEHRELLFRTGDWGTDMEDIYQFEMARFERWKGLEKLIQDRKTASDENKAVIDEAITSVKEEIKNFSYTNPETGKEITAEDFAKRGATSLPSLKFQGYGPYAGRTDNKTGMIKTSGGVLFPSMAIDYETSEIIRPNLLDLINLMSSPKAQIGLMMFKSANKGVTSRLNDEGGFTAPYKEGTRDFNLTASNVPVMEFNRKYIGIQLDTGFHIHHDVVFGTQMGKQILFAAYERGDIASNRQGDKANIEKYLELNKKRIRKGYDNLIAELGVEPVEGGYILPAGKKLDDLIKRLQKEVKSRDLPQNMSDTIELLASDNELKQASLLGVDTFINRETIENILYSVAERATNKQKFNGSAKYQVPSTFFETKEFKEKGIHYTTDKKGNKYLTSNELKFYMQDDTKTGAMEVYLPSYFEGLVNPGDKLDDKLLEIVGFRIPTQGPVSIDAIKVKGFLPPQAGDIIVLPTEIVKKAGSDYDIDKMQLYIPNYYTTLEGRVVYIDNNTQYEVYKKEMNKVLINRFKKNLFKAYTTEEGYVVNYQRKTRNVLEIIVNQALKSKSDPYDEISTLLDETIDREQDNDIESELIMAKGNLNTVKESIQQKISNRTEFEIMQIQNDMITTFRDIMLSPDNYEMMTGSIDSTLFDDYATLVQLKEQYPNEDLSGVIADMETGMSLEKALSKNSKKLSVSKNVSLHNLADRSYLNNIAKQNMDGAGAVGMAALASTFHIISTMEDFKVTIPKIRIKVGRDADDYSAAINLSHNKAEEGISLSHQKDANGGNRIGDILSLFVNAAVDNAKDPKLGKLNMTPATLNVALYLTIAGVPFSEISLFMSQPIVKEFVDIQAANESFYVEENSQGGLSQSKSTILKNLIEKYDSGSTITRSMRSTTKFTVADLSRMVGSGTEYGQEQAKILGDFVRYQESAKKFSNAVQAISYDTNGFGKNTAETLIRQSFTKYVLEDNFVDGLAKTLTDGYLSPYYKSVQDVIGDFKTQGVYAPLLYPLASQTVKDQLEKILIGDKKNPGFITAGVPRADVVTIADTWLKDLIAYKALQDKSFLPKNFEESVISEVERLKKAQEKSLSKSLLINRLVIVPDSMNLHGHKGLTFNSNNLDKIDSDQITSDWMALYKDDKNKEFAINLAKFALVQSGLQSVPNGFRKYIPAKIWEELMRNSVAKIRSNEIDFNEFNIMFALNNYHNNNIVPKATKFAEPKWYIPLMKKYAIKEKVNDKPIFETRPSLLLRTEDGDITVSPAKTGDMDFYYDPYNDQVRTAYGTTEAKEIALKISEALTDDNVLYNKTIKNSVPDKWNEYKEAMEANNKFIHSTFEQFMTLPLEVQNTMIEQAKNC